MRKGISKKMIGMIAAVTMTAAALTACKSEETPSSANGQGEIIEVSLGRQTLQNVVFPEGDSYEDNAYTRMAEAELKIDIVDEFEANGEDYDRQVSLALSAGEIPDMMKVGTLDELKELYENDLIADLTEVYDQYASNYLKDLYDSYEGRAIDNVTFDGKMVALPATNVDSGPSIVWIRSDWADQLELKIDEDNNKCITIEELEMVAKEFLDKNPENQENTVGIAVAPWITSGDPDGTYSINSIAYALGAYPKTWMEENGEVIYGSTTDEMKQALATTAEWFQEGILDPQTGTRTWDDITSLLANGQCGITFGTWHIPDWLLNNVYAMNSAAAFEAYAIEDANGLVNCKHNNATSGYIVVSKKFEHPEIAVQIANLFYDELHNSPELLEEYPEVNDYVKQAMDGSSRPFNIEINAYTSLLDDYDELEKSLNGEIAPEEIKSLEQKTNYESIKAYLDGSEDAIGWSKYHSRLKGVELIQTLTQNNQFQWLTPVFPETTLTMETNWANLEKLEEETFIKIVTGVIDVESGFEKFVADWKAQGGVQISQEIAEQLQ